MHYKPLALSDISLVRPILEKNGYRICDFTVSTMFMWRDLFRIEFAVENGTFYSRQYVEGEGWYHLIPIGDTPGIAMEKLMEGQSSLSFFTVPEPFLQTLTDLGYRYEATEQRDFFDYLYRAEDLRTLAGKKYSGQRNMIHQFLRENPVWSYEAINNRNLPAVQDFLREHYRVSDSAGPYEIEEEKKVGEVLSHFDEYDFVGSLLKAGDAVVGFSAGRRVGDTLFVHVEKADKQKKGAYQMLVHSFAERYADDSVLYINREDDMGDEGLRTSKLSYHPVTLLKKYKVTVYPAK